MLKWLKGTRRPPPVGSWAVFHPTVTVTAARTPTHHLNVQLSPHATFLQTHVRQSRLQTQIVRVGAVLAVGSAVYQFLTNLHTVPITGRTQVVVLTQEEECEMGTSAAKEEVAASAVITSGPGYRMCVDVAARLVSVAEHLFPREYEWRVWFIDKPTSANACCYPGGKIIVHSGLLHLIDQAVEKGTCKSKHDALAVVLAHEIAHALARHGAERMSYLPMMYLQALLGMESPLLKYGFEFAMNLPFSRKQETEADHVGLMLMASACYDPTEAPRFWRAFSELLADEDDDEEFDLDWFSTHPSNKKREQALEALVDVALEHQRTSSWCVSLKQKVQQLIMQPAHNEFFQRVKAALSQDAVRLNPNGRRNTQGTLHELENEEVFKAIRREQLLHQQQQQQQLHLAQQSKP